MLIQNIKKEPGLLFYLDIAFCHRMTEKEQRFAIFNLSLNTIVKITDLNHLKPQL